MSDDTPSGDRAVYLFLEMIALGFVLAAVDTGVNGKPLQVWGSCLVAGLVFFVLGVKWAAIRQSISLQLVQIIESIAHFTPLIVLGACAYVAITRSDTTYRFGALGFATGYIVIGSTLYVRRIRRDLDRYAMPRRLTDTQRSRLRSKLTAGAGRAIRIHVDPLNSEALQYASQLLNAFQQAGWTANLDTRTPYEPNEGLRINATGINVQPGAPHDPRPLIQAALAHAKIDTSGGGGVGGGEFEVFLAVGRRPIAIGVRPGFLFNLGRWMQWLGSRRR